MTTLLEEAPPETTITPSERLRSSMAAARLSFSWLGVRKSLTAQQKNQAADSFGAEGKYLSAGKKLLDTRHAAFKAVTAIRGRAIAYWKGVSLPFPEPGIRLIRQDEITAFDQSIADFRRELDEAVDELDRHYEELRNAARDRLGDLFNPDDYPPSLIGMFEIEHDYPSVEPPNYLRQLNPELYEQECDRVRSRFAEAIRLAEEPFTPVKLPAINTVPSDRGMISLTTSLAPANEAMKPASTACWRNACMPALSPLSQVKSSA